jgi:hypothetical protein
MQRKSLTPRQEEEAKLLELKRVLLLVVDEILSKAAALGREMLEIATIEGVVRKEDVAKTIIEIKKVIHRKVFSIWLRKMIY